MSDVMAAKYIVFDDPMVGPMAIIFPNFMIHADVARSMKRIPLSAGFVTISGGDVHIWGKSITLGCKSEPRDRGLIKRMLGINDGY